MIDISMKKAGAIYVVVILAIAGAYYYSLDSQDTFIRDTRWVSDKSALNLVMENAITGIFTYETTEIREKFPKGYKIGNSVNSIPIDDQEEFLDELSLFKQSVDPSKISQSEIDSYFQEIGGKYYYDEFQYTAAITTIDLELIIEHLKILSPSIPPIVVSTEIKEIKLKAISIVENNIWKVKMVVVDQEDGSYAAPDESLVRFFGYEP
ncbi:MAG: hypothetical protein ACXQS3_01035 [Candidatus Methanofastidiosia archaeon]